MKFKTALLAFAILAFLSAPVLAQEEDDAAAQDQSTASSAYAEKMAMTQFQQADVDKDKALTKDEFTHGKAMKGKSFETYDTNGDSSVTPEEWKAVQLKGK